MRDICRVAIDGIDGAGKTSTVQRLTERLQRQGASVARVERSGPESIASVAALTALIKASDGGSVALTPKADAHIRLARTYERLAAAAASGATVAIFDKWLPTELARLTQADFEDVRYLVADTIAEMHTLTVILQAPFDVTWQRILQRPEEQRSPKEMRGRQYNRVLYDNVANGIDRFLACGGRVHRIDSTQPIERVVDQILDLIVLKNETRDIS